MWHFNTSRLNKQITPIKDLRANLHNLKANILIPLLNKTHLPTVPILKLTSISKHIKCLNIMLLHGFNNVMVK